MERLVTPPRQGTSPTWGPPPPCEQALNKGYLKDCTYSIVCLQSTYLYMPADINIQQSLLINSTRNQFRGYNFITRDFVHLVGDDHVLQRFYMYTSFVTEHCLSLQFFQGFRTFKPLHHLCDPCHSCKKQFVA